MQPGVNYTISLQKKDKYPNKSTLRCVTDLYLPIVFVQTGVKENLTIHGLYQKEV